MSYVGPLTKNLFDQCIKEIKKKETKDKIVKYIFEPVMSEVVHKYSIYIIAFILLQVLIISLLIYVVYHI